MAAKSEAEGNSPHAVISAGQMGGGGVRTHTEFLCAVLRGIGAKVTLVGTQRGWPASDIAKLRETGVRLCAPPSVLAARRKLSPLYATAALPLWFPLRGRQITSVCFVGEGKYQFALSRWLGSKVPAIYHEVLDAPTATNSRGRCALAASAVIANSQVVAGQFHSFVGTIPVRVIPFLTADKPALTPMGRPAVGDRELKVVYIGRLAPQKRPDVLVQQWKLLTATSPLGPARLDVYGYDNGIRISDLNQRVVEMGIASKVKMHGAYLPSELDQILCNADVVVLPSTWEGLPLVLVEAMQRGVPIVTTNAGGCAEFSDENLDIVVTETEWNSFTSGLKEMAVRLRTGCIDSVRLHNWAEGRYGHSKVSAQWINALLHPNEFFGLKYGHYPGA